MCVCAHTHVDTRMRSTSIYMCRPVTCVYDACASVYVYTHVHTRNDLSNCICVDLWYVNVCVCVCMC